MSLSLALHLNAIAPCLPWRQRSYKATTPSLNLVYVYGTSRSPLIILLYCFEGDVSRSSGPEEDPETAGWQVASKKRSAKVLPLKPQSTTSQPEPQDHRKSKQRMPPERPIPPRKSHGNQSVLHIKAPKKIDTRPSHAHSITKGSHEGKILASNEATLAEALSVCGIKSEETTLSLEQADKQVVEPIPLSVISRDFEVSIAADGKTQVPALQRNTSKLFLKCFILKLNSTLYSMTLADLRLSILSIAGVRLVSPILACLS